MQFVSHLVTSLDFWTFVVALLALIATVWYGREQLRLARRQAENRPVLEVSAMDLINPAHVDAVVDTVRERREWLNEWERYEREKQERERKRADAPTIGSVSLGSLDFRPSLMAPDSIRGNNSLLIEQQDYQGPSPDRALRVTVVNKGKTAALDVSGQLYLDPAHLEPFDFPGLNADVEVHEDGTYRVNLHTSEGSRLLPAPTDEELTFDVAMLVKKSGTTSIRYAFATPQGDHVENTWSLDIPSST